MMSCCWRHCKAKSRNAGGFHHWRRRWRLCRCHSCRLFWVWSFTLDNFDAGINDGVSVGNFVRIYVELEHTTVVVVDKRTDVGVDSRLEG